MLASTSSLLCSLFGDFDHLHNRRARTGGSILRRHFPNRRRSASRAEHQNTFSVSDSDVKTIFYLGIPEVEKYFPKQARDIHAESAMNEEDSRNIDVVYAE